MLAYVVATDLVSFLYAGHKLASMYVCLAARSPSLIIGAQHHSGQYYRDSVPEAVSQKIRRWRPASLARGGVRRRTSLRQN